MIYFGAYLRSIAVLVLFVGCQCSLDYDLNTEEKTQRNTLEEELRARASEIVLPALMDSQTRYAEGYSEEAFRALQEGASRA